MILLLIAAQFSSPSIEIDASEELRDSWKSACESVARELPGEPGTWRIAIRQAATIEEFVARTGRARFEAAALAGDTIWLQAPAILDRFGDLDPIRRHECVHARLRFLGLPPLPRVVEEAIAIGISGQAARLPKAPPLDRREITKAEQILAAPRDRAIFERTLARAHATVWPKWSARQPDTRLAFLRELTSAGSAWVERF